MTRWGLLLVPVVLEGCTLGAAPPKTPSSHEGAAAQAPEGAASEGSSPALSKASPPTASQPGSDAAGAAPAGPSDTPDEEPDDGMESPDVDQGTVLREHPLDGFGQEKLERMLSEDPESLGPISLGRPNGGALFNGLPMPEGEGWELVDPSHAWGTQETVDGLAHCIEKVRAAFPFTPKMSIGHISGKHGGHLSPHVSHQAGRDVDVSYYYTSGGRWYAMARADNLDRARTWAFVRALITDTDVELILMDRSVQRLVKDYAASIGEDRGWLDQIFEGSSAPHAIVRHAKGHATHIHVRFYNPVAQETGRRMHALMLKHRLVEPPTYFAAHTAKPGDTLIGIARKYGTTPKVIVEANALRSDLIRIGRTYKIPRHGTLREVPGPLRIPSRRLPPERAIGANPTAPGAAPAPSAG